MERVAVVMASASRYRRELIARLGMDIACVASPFDEEAAKPSLVGRSAVEIAAALARCKAMGLSEQYPDALILGADQVVAIDDEVLGKPHTAQGARDQLKRLAGRTHELVTATALYDSASGRLEESRMTFRMTMRPLSDDEIADYVARDEPLDCAGSYRVESLGVALFERMEGDDYTSIVGLPLTHVVALLARFGVSVLGARG